MATSSKRRRSSRAACCAAGTRRRRLARSRAVFCARPVAAAASSRGVSGAPAPLRSEAAVADAYNSRDKSVAHGYTVLMATTLGFFTQNELDTVVGYPRRRQRLVASDVLPAGEHIK